MEENEILLAASKELWTKNTQTIITFKASLENIKSLAIRETTFKAKEVTCRPAQFLCVCPCVIL